ncbi:MAG: aspartate kinase [Thaumarchaeota archaeon]|nr:aspartate kinase [Nitrososphaerota archaeon]
MRLIMKFGGSSVDSASELRQVSELVKSHSQKNQIIVVVSALRGVTDSLLASCEKAEGGDKASAKKYVQDLSDKHINLVRSATTDKKSLNSVEKKIRTLIKDLEKLLLGVSYLGETTARSRDQILSYGERLSVQVLHSVLKDQKIKSVCLTGAEAGILTDSNFGEATPLMNVTKHQVTEILVPYLDKGVVPIVTGFIAGNQDHVVTTLGRGGSDYTATILASSVDADEVWFWTDVDGLMTADPRLIGEAKTILDISFREAMEMTIFGAKAMHPRALEPAMHAKIPVRIRNTFNPSNKGTLVQLSQSVKPVDIVKAVVLVKDVAVINLVGTGMVGKPGTIARIFDVLAKGGINVLMISQTVSEANVSLAIKRQDLDNAINSLETALLGSGSILEISGENDVSVIAVVGAGMKGTRGVAARVFQCVSEAKVNVRIIAQGSSELNISFVVKEKEAKRAVRAIHGEFLAH